jgi:hypothetical protein
VAERRQGLEKWVQGLILTASEGGIEIRTLVRRFEPVDVPYLRCHVPFAPAGAYTRRGMNLTRRLLLNQFDPQLTSGNDDPINPLSSVSLAPLHDLASDPRDLIRYNRARSKGERSVRLDGRAEMGTGDIILLAFVIGSVRYYK